ncbi:MAG TPA: sigma factor-like helix-turn-helix DNA-binding protein [Candidatus Saccharimonadia bacterium]
MRENSEPGEILPEHEKAAKYGYEMADISEASGLPSDDDVETEVIERVGAQQAVPEALKTISPRQREILEAEAGVHGPSVIHKEIGEKLGVTKQRVHFVATEAKKKMAAQPGLDVWRDESHAKEALAESDKSFLDTSNPDEESRSDMQD